MIELRAATLEDAQLLLDWRNDDVTRANSHNTGIVTMDDHLLWLARVLADSTRQLFIATSSGEPVGSVRADHYEGTCELSWTVAPSARGTGVGKQMVAQLASTIHGPLTAKVKPDNKASARIAEYAGMRLMGENDGILLFRRD